MRARSFFYVCAGVLMLAIAYHIGASNARAGYVDPSGPIVAASFSTGQNDRALVIRSDGTYWEWCGPCNSRWLRLDGDEVFDPPVPVSNIAFWSPTIVFTKSGEAWQYCEDNSGALCSPGLGWRNGGPIPLPPVQMEKTDWGEVKKKYREED